MLTRSACLPDDGVNGCFRVFLKERDKDWMQNYAKIDQVLPDYHMGV